MRLIVFFSFFFVLLRSVSARLIVIEINHYSSNCIIMLILSIMCGVSGKILSMKKSISKTDKKKKKELAEQTDKMEHELQKRHAEELSAMAARVQREHVSKQCNCRYYRLAGTAHV